MLNLSLPLIFYLSLQPWLLVFEGMWDRTITVSSSGKTFSITGWKVGWAIGPKKLIQPITLANQWVQYSVGTSATVVISFLSSCLLRIVCGFER
jgi:aspartate/methionine/tyrosine aminotransferase